MNESIKKNILITGCSSGIGYCAAKSLFARGYHVFATARKPEDVEKLKKEGLDSFILDLNDTESISQAVNTTLEKSAGRLDALFNNGAYGQPGAVEDLSRDTLRQQFECNFFGTHELTRQIIPTMRKQGYGRIIQNSSVLGFVALPYRGAYIASKYALEGLSDTLRLELSDTNISISLIEPGPIESLFRKNAYQAFIKNINQENSSHHDRYQSLAVKLEQEGHVVPFTLPADAVIKKLIHALESKHPKCRYCVTLPTYAFAFLKKLLTDKAMDRILLKASGARKR